MNKDKPLDLGVLQTLVRMHADDVDASVRFYVKLQFAVVGDEVFGDGTRVVQMRHPQIKTMVLIVRTFPDRVKPAAKQPDAYSAAANAALTLVVDQYLDWLAHLDGAGIPIVHRESHPWGIWIYIKDPADNLIELTISDRC
jgi:catechol 2,3-dioxygenase-like lactoylglutathione lyase family enzyme